MPKISIVIPCYNHGQYIDEAIQSVEQISDESLYEIIIVNDGSSDDFTNRHLEQLSSKGYHVIVQQNMGLSAARNTGISAATSDLILLLDADNKIDPRYIYRSIEILTEKPEISIVYSDSQLFGDESNIRRAAPFNLQKLMLDNYIDACAVIRKDVWVRNSGYDTNMKTGLEDWEFWLHSAFNGYKFWYIPEPLYHYRVLKTSMVHQLIAQKRKSNEIQLYMMKKHQSAYGPQFIDEDILAKFASNPVGYIFKLVLKRYFPKQFDKLTQEGRLRIKL